MKSAAVTSVTGEPPVFAEYPPSTRNTRNTYRSPSLRYAWNLGRRTAVRGKDLSECPYGADRMTHRIAWYEGHKIGVEEADS